MAIPGKQRPLKIQEAVVRTLAVALAAAGTAYEAAPVSAADGILPISVQDRFRSLDVNHDGFVSKGEVRRFPGYVKALEEADENHDGRLDFDEFIKAEAIYQRQQAAAYLEDSLLTARIKAALMKEPQLKSSGFSVETFRGHVLLSGFVDSVSQRRKAMQVASSVEGVISVKDGLAVR